MEMLNEYVTEFNSLRAEVESMLDDHESGRDTSRMPVLAQSKLSEIKGKDYSCFERHALAQVARQSMTRQPPRNLAFL